LPEEYFSFSWNAPPKFKEVRESDYHTWVVVDFKALPDNQTEVTLTHLGWPADEKWAAVYDYFVPAWENVMKQLADTDKPDEETAQKTKKVTGIGGVFFKCKDPKKLKAWYAEHLGIVSDQYGTNFEWRKADDPAKKGYTVWSPFIETTKYFEPSEKEFMINYRVENLEALVEELKKEGVTILDKIETYEYGKFVHIMDIEGNNVELWEPDAAVFEKVVNVETK
jgi:predicted enzyme related to lactoylglutathione lyase